jgi:hypothetical protein
MNLDTYRSDTLEHRVANRIDDNLEQAGLRVTDALVALKVYEGNGEPDTLAAAVEHLEGALRRAQKALTLAEVLAS